MSKSTPYASFSRAFAPRRKPRTAFNKQPNLLLLQNEMLRIISNVDASYAVLLILSLVVYMMTFGENTGIVSLALSKVFVRDSDTYRLIMSNLYRILGCIVVGGSTFFTQFGLFLAPCLSFALLLSNASQIWVYYAISVCIYVSCKTRFRTLTIACACVAFALVVTGGSTNVLADMNFSRLSEVLSSDSSGPLLMRATESSNFGRRAGAVSALPTVSYSRPSVTEYDLSRQHSLADSVDET